MGEFTPEQETIRQTVNRICREKLAPRAAEMDRTGEFPWDILKEFARAGLTSMFFPVEYGGLGKDLITSTMVVEEIAKCNTATAHTFTGIASSRLPLLLAGTDEQKKRYMPRLIREAGVTCLSITEPNAGSDVAGMETRAVMAKLFASDMAMQVTVDAVQALGGYGVVTDHPVERMMRDAKILQIFDGTNQIQRVIIARGLLK